MDTIHGIDPQNEFDILKIKLSAAIWLLLFVFLLGFLGWQFDVVIGAKLLSLIFQDFINQIIEGWYCLLIMFGRCFTVAYPDFISNLFGLVILNLSFAFKVVFIAYQHHFYFIDVSFLV